MPSRPLTRTFSTPRPSSGLASNGHSTLRATHRHADPDALALAREVADRRAAASARPVQRGTTRDDPDRREPHDLWRPVAGQGVLFDLNAPTQLALFGDAVAANEGEL